MATITHLECSLCGATYAPDEVTYTCPTDGGNLTVQLDIEQINAAVSPEDIQASSERSMWRYLPLLPVADPGLRGSVLRSVGFTPLHRPAALAAQLGLEQFWVKDEGGNPTASFKDRASALLVARARQMGLGRIVTASTGNAGAALAGMAAAAGHPATIIAPKNAPPAKIAQLLVYGAQVVLVKGNYDAAFDLSIQATGEFGWYNRNTGYNPFTTEGKKTAAFELWEQLLQLASLKKPLCVFVSVGDGNIISGIHKGFQDMLALGWLSEMPRIFGVQSAQSAAIANAFAAGTEEIQAVQATTLADSIAVDLPRDGLRALRAATHTNGAYITVADTDILQAIADLGRVGIFAEPAGAASLAGVKQALAQGIIDADAPVVMINTGNGLKDVGAAMQSVGAAPVIAPTLEALRQVI